MHAWHSLLRKMLANYSLGRVLPLSPSLSRLGCVLALRCTCRLVYDGCRQTLLRRAKDLLTHRDVGVREHVAEKLERGLLRRACLPDLGQDASSVVSNISQTESERSFCDACQDPRARLEILWGKDKPTNAMIRSGGLPHWLRWARVTRVFCMDCGCCWAHLWREVLLAVLRDRSGVKRYVRGLLLRCSRRSGCDAVRGGATRLGRRHRFAST